MTNFVSKLLEHAAPISGGVAVLLTIVSALARVWRASYKLRLVAIKRAPPDQLEKLVGDEYVRLGISAKDTTQADKADFVKRALKKNEKDSQRVFIFALVVALLFAIVFVVVVIVDHSSNGRPQNLVQPESAEISDTNIDKTTLENKIISLRFKKLGLNKEVTVSYLIKDGKRHRIVSPTIIKYFYEHRDDKSVTEAVANLFPDGDKITYRDGMYVKHYAPSMCNGGCPRYMIIENKLRPISDPVAATYGCTPGKAVEMLMQDIDGSAESLYNPAPSLKEKENESGVAKTIKCLEPRSE